MQSPSFRDVVISGLDVGAERSFNVSGGLIAVLAASEAFELSFGDDSFFYVAAGLGYRPMGTQGEVLIFKSIRVRNTGANPLAARLQVGTGEIVDNRAIFGGTAVPVQPITFDGSQPIYFDGTQPVAFDGPQPVTQSGVWNVGLTGVFLPRAVQPTNFNGLSTLTIPAADYAQIVAADAGRKSVTVKHIGSEGMIIRSQGSYGGSGIEIAPGELLTLDMSGDLYAVNLSSFSQQMRIAKTDW